MEKERLIHYSGEPFDFDPKYNYSQNGDYKPSGFWVSVEGEYNWKSWCEAEEFHLNQLSLAYEVILKPNVPILHLKTYQDIDQFNKEYVNQKEKYIRYIRWNEVKSKYSGLIISPYQWKARMEFMWYYGWDCASGCIWNLSTIESVNLIKEKICSHLKHRNRQAHTVLFKNHTTISS